MISHKWDFLKITEKNILAPLNLQICPQIRIFISLYFPTICLLNYDKLAINFFFTLNLSLLNLILLLYSMFLFLILTILRVFSHICAALFLLSHLLKFNLNISLLLPPIFFSSKKPVEEEELIQRQKYLVISSSHIIERDTPLLKNPEVVFQKHEALVRLDNLYHIKFLPSQTQVFFTIISILLIFLLLHLSTGALLMPTFVYVSWCKFI